MEKNKRNVIYIIFILFIIIILHFGCDLFENLEIVDNDRKTSVNTDTDFDNNIKSNPNLITNGDFSNDLSDWILYNNGSGKADIMIDNDECVIEILAEGLTENTTLFKHAGISLEYGETYIFRFQAKSSSIDKIGVTFIGQYDNGYDPLVPYKEYSVSSLVTKYEFIFTMTKPTNNEAVLYFYMGNNGEGTIILDNISLKKYISENNSSNLVRNGDFNNNTISWELLVLEENESKTSLGVENSEGIISIDDQGTAIGYIALCQSDIFLEWGKTYTLRFHTRSDITRDLEVRLYGNGHGNYYRKKYSINTKMQEYSFTFTMDSSTIIEAALYFELRNTNSGKIYFDNISLTKD